MILIVLAAGRGSRLKNKTDNLPKCLVKIKGKPIINYMEKFINKFKKTFIVCGYKRNQLLRNFKKNRKIDFIYNKDYKTTNMVHSLFLVKKKHIGNNDVVISYSDIIFDESIYKIFERKQSFITVYKNWYKYWKKRMEIVYLLNMLIVIHLIWKMVISFTDIYLMVTQYYSTDNLHYIGCR